MPHFFVFRVAFVLSLASCLSSRADLPAPQWIWTRGDRGENQAAFFRKPLSVRQEVKSAHLVAAADFSHMTVSCNGQRIAAVEDYGPRIQADITHAMHAGDNVLAIAGIGSKGPSAVAVRLTLVYEDGTEQIVLTDTAWRTARSRQAGWQQPEFIEKGWQPAVAFGAVGVTRFGDPISAVRIDAADDYTQWKQALGADASADPATFAVPAGFEIELLRSARDDEGSWVSMTFDPTGGRLIIARESKGLLGLTLPTKDQRSMSVEVVENTLEECRGLLFAHGYLYANANNSKGLYRLRDSTDDGHFDEIELLYHSKGGVGHGRNDLALGPDGMIYSIHGDAVDLPVGFFDLTSPFRKHRRGNRSNEGHVIRMDRDGGQRTLVAGGLRNPFGIDFSPEGELFTYDADAEFDMGTSWYRPTRVHHVLPGGDYGWRAVTRQWPPYFPDHPDAAPPNLDIGKGSPTAVQFGTRSNFPHPYRQALFILDWAYGRIIAVDISPRGASYACRAETFARGRPMNVTDVTFGPDGAMYFITGGRNTRSGLYRIRYSGPTVQQQVATAQQRARSTHAAAQRAIRRRLESWHGKQGKAAIALAWPHLDSPDPWLRHAARVAIEHQPVPWWATRAFSESRTTASLTALLALAGSGESRLRPRILSKLRAIPTRQLSTSQWLIALRIYELCVEDRGALDDRTLAGNLEWLESQYPAEAWVVNRELSRLLAPLESQAFVGKTIALLEAATEQAEQLHCMFVLRTVRAGWTPDLRGKYFGCFGLTNSFSTGEGMEGFIRQIKDDALATLSDAERIEMEAILTSQQAEHQDSHVVARPFVYEWNIDELMESTLDSGEARDLERGKRMFTQALCVRCHRLGDEGRALGPDLTAVSSRFSRRNLLESIISPSTVVAEKYRKDVIETADGRVFAGSVVLSGDYRSPLLKIATDPLAPGKLVDIVKSEIVTRKKSSVSQMPAGLLNTLSKDEILDLMAYIEVGGHAAR